LSCCVLLPPRWVNAGSGSTCSVRRRRSSGEARECFRSFIVRAACRSMSYSPGRDWKRSSSVARSGGDRACLSRRRSWVHHDLRRKDSMFKMGSSRGLVCRSGAACPPAPCT
jgi:hypothetical protein